APFHWPGPKLDSTDWSGPESRVTPLPPCPPPFPAGPPKQALPGVEGKSPCRGSGRIRGIARLCSPKRPTAIGFLWPSQKPRCSPVPGRTDVARAPDPTGQRLWPQDWLRRNRRGPEQESNSSGPPRTRRRATTRSESDEKG